MSLEVDGTNVEVVHANSTDPAGCTGELIAEVVDGNLEHIRTHPVLDISQFPVITIRGDNALSVVVYVALNTGFAPIDFAVCVGP